jgi:DNA segregation ATPase FtsK/SpoIIIE, S-DNA-T family
VKDLFRRLKGWLQKFENPEYEEMVVDGEQDDVYSPAGNKNLSIRTARIYPKGELVEREQSAAPLSARLPRATAGRNMQKKSFRFPLIPDEQAAEQSSPRPLKQNRPEKQRTNIPASSVIRHTEPSKKTDVPMASAPVQNTGAYANRPFRPTEVISPIYGYKRPEPKEKMEMENIQEPVEHLETSHRQASNHFPEKLTVPVDERRDEPQLEWEEEKPDWFIAGLETSAVDSRAEQNIPCEAEPIIIKREESREEMERTTGQYPSLIEVVQQKQLERDAETHGLPSQHTLQISQLEEKPILQSKRPNSPEPPKRSEQIEPPEQIRPAERIKRPASYTPGEPSIHLPVQGQLQQQAGSGLQDDGFYGRPSTSLLQPALPVKKEKTDFVNSQQELLAVTLQNFHVNAEVIGAVQGPTVTRYEIQPAPGVKVNKITNLVDDIKLSLAARDIRIEAPIPGRSAVGIEVPNEESVPVYLRGIFESEAFRNNPSPLAVALGLDIGGEPVIADLSKMPHGLIAGSTGSGKSVCINSIIVSLLYKASPDEVRLLLIDPKMVELAPYNRLPHLVAPVVTDPKQATAALKWAVGEMDRRYEKFAEAGARDISRYNQLMRRSYPEIKEYVLPTIVIIIDELADLMMVAPGDVEESICRIAQKARACGIHLLVATQRPSVDVITGLIKANIPTRIAFSVSSQTDSRTILDMNGAERLLGRGDMLYLSSGSSKPVRLQGPYVSDEEIEAVTEFVKSQAEPNYLFEKEDLNQIVAADQSDELFAEAVLFCVENGQASASSLQRNFHIGYNRAARLIDMMTDRGFISGQSGSKARDVFLTQSEYQEIFQNESRV